MRAQYTSHRLHSEGGLGKIWLARDEMLHRDVVLKELHSRYSQESLARARFLREAQITAQLEHPSIVPVYEIGRHSDHDEPYYTMRFVRGGTLEDRIQEYHQRKEAGQASPLDLPRLLNALVSVGNAIAYAHSRGVVHRDLKPSNVVIGQFGEVVLLDWGLAKVLGSQDCPDERVDLPQVCASGQDTGDGAIVGTPAYMSPEQACVTDCPVGPTTDIYGLGGILYEILTGRPPHTGKNFDQLIDSMTGSKPPRVCFVEPSLPPELDAVCAKAMARSVDERYGSVSELIDDIQRWLADTPVSVYRESIPRRTCRWVRHHRTLAATGIVFLAFLLLFGANLLRLTLLERQDQLATTLIREIGLGVEALQALQSHYSTNELVSREDFRTFTKPYLEREGGLRALEWIPVVPGRDRPAFEEQARQAGLSGFSFMERSPQGELVRAEERATYYPVYFLEPREDNEEALGFDLGSSPERMEAVRQARARQKAIASAPIDLVQERGECPGILILRPLVEQDRHDDGQGYVLGVYGIERLLESAWRDISTEHLQVWLYDVTDPAKPYLLWSNRGPDVELGPVDKVHEGLDLLSWPVTKEMEVCGRTWKLVTRATPAFLLYYPSSR